MKRHRALLFASMFSGAGVGLLIGLLISLSLSNVVGGVLSGLTALLAAFLGVTELLPGKKEPQEAADAELGYQQRIRALKSGSFGVACIMGVVLGLFIRTHNSLGVSAADQFKQWKTLGFADEKARELVVYQQLHILPTGAQKVGQEKNSPDISVLYQGHLEQCAGIEPRHFKYTDEVLRAWKQESGPWQEAARVIEATVDESNRKSMIDATWRLACSQRN